MEPTRRNERWSMDFVHDSMLMGEALDAWAYAQGIKLQFIEPGKPMRNACVESFNGKLRDECLNEDWFVGPEDAKRFIEDW